MGNRRNWSGTAALILVAGTAHAADRGQVRITPFIGLSQVKVDGQHLEFGESERRDGWTLGISAGYRTSFGAIFEIGTSSSGQPFFGWATPGELRESHVAAGYDLEFADGWHFTPKIGLTKWKLHGGAFEALVNEAGEPRDTLHGSDPYVELGIGRAFNDRFGVGLAFKAADVDFGSSTSTTVTFTLGF